MENFKFYTSKEQLNHYVLISLDSGFLLVFEPGNDYLDISVQITKNNTTVIQNELAYWTRHFNIPIIELVPINSIPDHPNDFYSKYVDFVEKRNLPMVSFHVLQYFHKDSFKRAKSLCMRLLLLMGAAIAWAVYGERLFLLLSGVMLLLLLRDFRGLAHNTNRISLVAKDIKVFEEQTGVSIDDVNYNDRSILERRYIKK